MSEPFCLKILRAKSSGSSSYSWKLMIFRGTYKIFVSPSDIITIFFQIARDSRRLSDEHEAAALAIIGLADNALNASREALRLLSDTVAQKNNNTAVLDELRREQSLLQSLQTRVQNLASMAKDDADKAYNEALEIYTQASSLSVPKIDVPAMLSQANDIDVGSKQIANSSNNLLSGKTFCKKTCR